MRVLSVSTALYDGYPMAMAIERMAAADIKYVEPAYIKGYVDFTEADFDHDSALKFRTLLKASGLSVHAISAHMQLGDHGALEMLHRRIAFAAEIGASVLIVNGGAVSAKAAIVDHVTKSLKFLESAGITLAIENPGHGHGDIVGNAGMGAELVKTVDAPFFQLNYDAGNIWTYSGLKTQPATDIAKHMGIVANMHLKDVDVHGDDLAFCALGSGQVDYEDLWPLLPSDLSVTLELPLRLYRPNRGDPLRASEPLPLETLDAALVHSVTFVRDLDDLVWGRQ